MLNIVKVENVWSVVTSGINVHVAEREFCWFNGIDIGISDIGSTASFYVIDI